MVNSFETHGHQAPILSQEDIDGIQLKTDDLDMMLELIHCIELYPDGFTQFLVALRDPGVEQLELATNIQLMEREERAREERQILISLYQVSTEPLISLHAENMCKERPLF